MTLRGFHLGDAGGKAFVRIYLYRNRLAYLAGLRRLGYFYVVQSYGYIVHRSLNNQTRSGALVEAYQVLKGDFCCLPALCL